MVTIKRFDIFLANLDPVVGAEMRKTRPCVIISPDEMNQHLRTVIIAPMTTAMRLYPTRVALTFQGKNGQIVLDQLRTFDQQRLVKKLGTLSNEKSREVCEVLEEMFEYE